MPCPSRASNWGMRKRVPCVLGCTVWSGVFTGGRELGEGREGAGCASVAIDAHCFYQILAGFLE